MAKDEAAHYIWQGSSLEWKNCHDSWCSQRLHVSSFFFFSYLAACLLFIYLAGSVLLWIANMPSSSSESSSSWCCAPWDISSGEPSARCLAVSKVPLALRASITATSSSTPNHGETLATQQPLPLRQRIPTIPLRDTRPHQSRRLASKVPHRGSVALLAAGTAMKTSLLIWAQARNQENLLEYAFSDCNYGVGGTWNCAMEY